MKHLDLFSGIGGFSYALDQVVADVEHVFCDNNTFCQQVINKHWKDSKIYGDIKEITNESADIVTGGFPCQPFSTAGKKRGTADDRYLWPEMLRVIRLAKPAWIVAENVRGLVTWNNGLVFEQVCSDLESEGYEIQPFIIPACAVNAPHRRERVWFVAYSPNNGRTYRRSLGQTRQSKMAKIGQTKTDKQIRQRWQRQFGAFDTVDGWKEVAARVCRNDDGLPDRVDRLKSLGNAIVPQVAIEVFKSMEANL